MSRNCIQLEMNFNGSFENRFKDRLDNGEFQIFAELTAPSADTRLEDAVQRFADLNMPLCPEPGMPQLWLFWIAIRIHA